MTRQQPRDLYDSYHLLGKSVAVEASLVQEKLDDYGLTYQPDAIVERARALEPAWASLEPLVASALPDFEATIRTLERNLPPADAEE